MDQIFPQMWIKLDKEVREHLIKIFSISRTGITEIVDQTIVSDGYTVDDLKAISLEKMNEYIGSEETFGRAWEITLSKVKHELHPPLGQIGDSGTITPIEEDTRPNLSEVLSEETKQYGSNKKKN